MRWRDPKADIRSPASFRDVLGARARGMRRAGDRGRLARRHRSVPRRGRAAARCHAWRHGDQRRHGAGQGGQGKTARSRREDRRKAARRRADRDGRGRRARLHQSDPEAARLGRCAAHGARARARTTAEAASARAEKVNVEYVSANPTGPMHVGHCRGAVFGDALASLLQFAGYDVTREYYINDAGAQVDVLARSAYPALPRGARRGHRRDSGRALSRRLSEAGRAGARRRTRRQAARRCRRATGCRSCATRRSR